MVELGYKLSSEEHAPPDLVRHAKLAEEAGFGFALISDHYHPWTDRQGHSAFVWGVIGAISESGGSNRVAASGVGTPRGDRTVTSASPVPREVMVFSTS